MSLYTEDNQFYRNLLGHFLKLLYANNKVDPKLRDTSIAGQIFVSIERAIQEVFSNKKLFSRHRA